MKIASIKKLVNQYTLSELQKAEEYFYQETKTLNIEIEGDDEGERLTHVLAAIEIKVDMAKGAQLNEAIRNFSQRVRKSIG